MSDDARREAWNAALAGGNPDAIRSAGDALIADVAARIIRDDRYVERTRGEPDAAWLAGGRDSDPPVDWVRVGATVALMTDAEWEAVREPDAFAEFTRKCGASS